MTRDGDKSDVEPTPFSIDDLPPASGETPARMSGTDYLTLAHDRSPEHRPASYVRGVSLAAVLQLLHLERKTCHLEIIGEGGTGKLTLVNGELADADAEGCRGEEAVFRILTWHRPRTTIIEGVGLFRHSVTRPIPHLLLEAARRQDEGVATPQAPSCPGATMDDAGPTLGGDAWHRLTESLIINGALLAAVVRADDAKVLAVADEYGRLALGAADAQIAQLAPLFRTLRNWGDLVDPSIDELIAVIGSRHYLVRPIDESHALFACVALGSTESLELSRQAIRNASG